MLERQESPDPAKRFGGLRLDAQRQRAVALTVRRVDTGKKNKIANTHAVTQTALRQRQIVMAKRFTVAAGRRDRIDSNPAIRFKPGNADQRDGGKIFGILAKSIAQHLRNFRCSSVARQVDHQVDDTIQAETGCF